MIANAPLAHMWLTVPAGCRIEGELITEDELRFVFGDPRADGHTIEFDRKALERFRALIGDLLNASTSDDPHVDDPDLINVA